MQSCIYEGQVRHARTRPVSHRFRYRIFMMYLDLAELPALFENRWFWSARETALARFRRSDHLGPPEQSLDASVRQLVARATGDRPSGPIRLLTNLSYYGYCFNPVSFYYCFADDGETLETIVAEVTNTPWGEQETYVLPRKHSVGRNGAWRFQPRKKMHVSPFMDMDIDYGWSFSVPSERNHVLMANSKDGECFFNAAMTLKRQEINGASLARVLLTFPFITFKIVMAIYWQALRLWLKRVPLYVHPKKKKKITVKPL